jgi:flagellar L-ring protein precursor FlgH
MNRSTLVACAAVALLAAGCGTLSPQVDVGDTQPVRPVAVPPPAVNNGSIFQGVSYRPLFEDHRARLAGDTITINIVEKVQASQKSTSTVDKAGSVDASVTALPGISAGAFRRAAAQGSSSNTFSGKGTTESANTFSGTITAQVVEVLPNGHLLIAGEKQIGVHENVDVLKFTGQVDPRTIQPGNMVASAQVANVRIQQRGRGAQAEAQQIGWLGRFFLNVLPL